MKPKVTVGVCVRNSESTIQEAIASITQQDFPHELMEVVLVDDGSEDDTLLILKDCALVMDMKVKVFHHKWKGLGASRNVVVDHTHGDYIVWVDGDMVLPRDHISQQVSFMEENPRVGIGKAKYGLRREENVIGALQNIPFVILDVKPGSFGSKLPGTGGAIFRVSALRKAGSFDSHMSGVGEDQDVAYRIKASGWAIERSPALFYERRPQTWSGFWRKHFWYGFGNYQLYRKNRVIFSLYKMVPIAGFAMGVLCLVDAYRLTHRKSVLLLPFHYALKQMAWCFGFATGQMSGQKQ